VQSSQRPPRHAATQEISTVHQKKQTRWLPADGPWKASRQHFAGARSGKECPALSLYSPAQPPTGPPGSISLFLDDGRQEAATDPREDIWCIPDNDDSVRAIIAIVPDPIHSHMTLVFDRSIEAIQLAADNMKYVIDQYWLPWESEPKQWGDYESWKKAGVEEQERQELPGLLMFRWTGDTTENQSKVRLLYVFLVSDTATSGINGTQFTNAADYARDVLCPKQASSPAYCKALRVIGPSFSGSLASLHDLASQRPETFTVYSGTVSSATAIQQQHFDKIKPPLTFRPFVNDSESAIWSLLNFLREKHELACNDAPEVAILFEAATTYGSAPRGSAQPCRYTSFSYPREISSLRNAYKQMVSDATSPTDNAAGTGKPYLSLNLSDPTNSSDEPPDFSKQQGPLSKEAVLMQFAAQIRRDHYKYVGIVGSNVLDVMFLTNFLRKACPDTRLFVVNSDLLFERELDNAPYLGMMAVSTYPLLASNLDWTNPKELQSGIGPRFPRLPFSDQLEEGQYNAALVTIKEIADGPQVEPYEYHVPFETNPPSFDPKSTRLPLWITAVGTGGYWPIQVSSNGEKTPDVQFPELKSTDFSPAWNAAVTLLCVFAFLHIAILLTASPLRQFRDLALVTTVPAQRLFFIHMSSAMVAVALTMLATPAWRYGLHGTTLLQSLVLFIAVPLALIGIVFTCVLLHANYIFRLKWEREKGKASDSKSVYITCRVASLSIWVLAIVLLWLWWLLFNSDPAHYGFFFAFRTIHLATGVSPFTPLLPLFIAIYAWTVFEVWRLRFNNQVRPRLNVHPPFPGAVTEGPIAAAVNRYFLDRNYLLSFTLIYLVWLAFFDLRHPFQLFERRPFGWIYEVLFCLVMALMLSAGFRFGQIWSKLKDLLNELERSRIRLAFSRLKGFSWSPIWRPGGRGIEWVNMARSFEALRYIAVCGASDGPQRKGIEALQTAMEDVQSKLQQAEEQLTELGIRESVQPELQEIRSTMEHIRVRLTSGRASESLQKKAIVVQSTLQDLLQFPEEYATNAAIQFALLKIHSQLRAIHGALALMDAPALTQEKVGDIVEVTSLLRSRKISSPLVHTLREYRQFLKNSTSDDSLAEAFYDLERSFGEVQAVLATTLNAVLEILQDHWTTQCPELVEGEELEKDDKQVTVYCQPEETNPEEQHVRRLEEYVALRYVAFIRGALGHMRHLLIFLGLSFSLVLISLNIYSFEPHQSLIWSFTAIFAAIGFTVVVVLMQAHKDHILSRITGTTPNELGIAFYLRIISFGAAPLLTLLATHFPSIGRYLLSFLQPGLEALK
jgi:hypothetical protein